MDCSHSLFTIISVRYPGISKDIITPVGVDKYYTKNNAMETKRKETAKKEIANNDIKKEVTAVKKKSKVTLWWEAHPHGVLEIVDIRAVLK